MKHALAHGLGALVALGAPACGGPQPSVGDCGPTSLRYRTTAAQQGYAVVAEHPHDPEAFTQGLLFDDGALFESTGLWGASTLRRVDLASGQVQQQVALDEQLWGEGLASWQGQLIQLTWQAGRAFVYERDSFALNGERTYPTEGWGLTSHGDSLVMSDGTAALYFLDPTTFAERRRVTVRDGGEPVTRLNELEQIHGEIWANVWRTERIARIDPRSGRVLGWVILDGIGDRAGQTGPEEVLNGIAFDAEGCRLFVTGKRWPRLFEIEID